MDYVPRSSTLRVAGQGSRAATVAASDMDEAAHPRHVPAAFFCNQNDASQGKFGYGSRRALTHDRRQRR
jgi:hypothetical protein